MASITIDGLDEEVFRRNIEAMLRVGEADLGQDLTDPLLAALRRPAARQDDLKWIMG